MNKRRTIHNREELLAYAKNTCSCFAIDKFDGGYFVHIYYAITMPPFFPVTIREGIWNEVCIVTAENYEVVLSFPEWNFRRRLDK